MNLKKFEKLSDKKKLDFWLENLLVAHAVFSVMPKKSIIKNLNFWRADDYDCGSPACFGGWVARMPYFQKRGVAISRIGSPYLPEDNDFCVSRYLFGSSFMFESRNEGGNLSDVDVIIKRIENQINCFL